MNTETLKPIVISLLNRVAPDQDAAQLDEDVNFRQEIGLDSFDTLQFLSALSEALHIDIPEADYGQITTIRSLVAYLAAKSTPG